MSHTSLFELLTSPPITFMKADAPHKTKDELFMEQYVYGGFLYLVQRMEPIMVILILYEFL